MLRPCCAAAAAGSPATQAPAPRATRQSARHALRLLAIAILSSLLCAGQHQRDASHDFQRRVKRALYELPDGAEYIVGPQMRTTFTCDGLGYGYYADPDNDCKIFHICQSFKMYDGSIYNNHWSFLCGNQTVFNQVSLACTHPEDAVPCENARDFYHVNDYFGDLSAPSVRQTDLLAAQELVSRSYGSRIAPGAGARPSGSDSAPHQSAQSNRDQQQQQLDALAFSR